MMKCSLPILRQISLSPTVLCRLHSYRQLHTVGVSNTGSLEKKWTALAYYLSVLWACVWDTMLAATLISRMAQCGTLHTAKRQLKSIYNLNATS